MSIRKLPKVSLEILDILKTNPDGVDIYDIRESLSRSEVQQHLDRRLRELDPFYIIERERKGKSTVYKYKGERDPEEWPYTDIPKDVRARLLEEAKGTCQMCGRTVSKDGIKLHVDHRTPKSLGGDNSEDNLWVICSVCNEGKNNSFISTDKISSFLDRIHNKDINELLRELPDNSVDCIYSDIDYNVGIKYSGKSYTKAFEKYMSDYIALSAESTRVLKDNGSAFFINYPKNNAYLWVQYLDRAYYDVQEYVWVYNSNIGHSPRRFTTAHRSILHCMKSKENQFYKNNVAEPYVNQTDRRIRRLMKGGSRGRSPYSWFYADMVKNVSKWSKKIDHPCVIPSKISSMLIKSVTKPGDTVLVLFAGSGSEIDVCRKLGRHWISADLDSEYCEKIERKLDEYIITFEEKNDDSC